MNSSEGDPQGLERGPLGREFLLSGRATIVANEDTSDVVRKISL